MPAPSQVRADVRHGAGLAAGAASTSGRARRCSAAALTVVPSMASAKSMRGLGLDVRRRVAGAGRPAARRRTATAAAARLNRSPNRSEMSKPPPPPTPAAEAAGDPPKPPPAPANMRAHLVVLLALLGVADDVVGLGDLLEPVLRGLVARVGVGVVLARQLAVGLLDLAWLGVLGHAEDLVEVLVGPVSVGSSRTSSSRRRRVLGRAVASSSLLSAPSARRGCSALLRLQHGDPRRAHDAVADPVARLDDHVDGRGRRRRRSGRASAPRGRGSNSSPLAPNFVSPSAVDDPLQRVGDGLEAALELAVLAGPVDVVEHRQQLGQHRERRRSA